MPEERRYQRRPSITDYKSNGVDGLFDFLDDSIRVIRDDLMAELSSHRSDQLAHEQMRRQFLNDSSESAKQTAERIDQLWSDRNRLIGYIGALTLGGSIVGGLIVAVLGKIIGKALSG